MPTNRYLGILNSGAFRFAMVLAMVFVCSSALLLWTTQRQVSGYASDATKAMLKSESAVLAGEYQLLGLSGLTDALARHGAVERPSQFRYLLMDGNGVRLFGDLPKKTAYLGWHDLLIPEADGSSELFKLLGTRLPNGLMLVVATDSFDIDSMRQRLITFTLWSGIAITIFALGGGYWVGRIFLRRLDNVNSAVSHIIKGDYNKKLPAIGVAPEFDKLTQNLNHMLERNAGAIDALKHVSTAIAHDLRTPLTKLRQSLDNARETGNTTPAVIDEAIIQVDNIIETFQALLRIGMLEGGIGRARFSRVNMSEILGRIHQAYEPAAEDAQHTLIADHQSDVYVDGDANLLAQMFTNLIENAICHTPAGTRIVTQLSADGEFAIARVSDNGPGVVADDREKVFRKFYRVDSNRTTPGAGLGLSLVAAIADLHQATYEVVPSKSGFSVELRFKRSD